MLVQGRGRLLGACAVLVSCSFVAASCSRSADTTQLSADQVSAHTAVPTTLMQTSGGSRSTTTTSPSIQNVAAASPTDLTSTLSLLVNQFASNPALVEQIANLDLASLAGLVGVDEGSLRQLGLTVPEIQQLGLSVLGSSPDLLASLTGGSIDPATLIGLLAGSVDLNSIVGSASGALVQALIGSITGLKVVISPELTLQLNDLLDSIDPNADGPAPASPQNAALLALLTSAIINSNPLLAEQLLASPLLDPTLQPLLVQLQALGQTLGDTASAALLDALNRFFPGLLAGLGITPPA